MTGSHRGATAGDREAHGPSFQVGQVYVDVRRRVLEFLNAEAARLHAAGLPFTAADPMIPNLYRADGGQVTAADLPLAVAWGTAKPAEARFLWAGKDGVMRQVFWSAAPFPRSAPLAGILGNVTCIVRVPGSPPPSADPDWQQLAELAHDLAAPLHSLALIAQGLERAVSGRVAGAPEVLGVASSSAGAPADPAVCQPDLLKRLEIMQRTARRALEIGADLLRQCRGPAPRSRRRRDWLNLDSFLNGVVEEHTVAAARKGLTITTNFASGKGWDVFTDPIPLGRLLSNLVVNAIRYTAVGRIEVSARWRGQPGQSALAVSVADTGQGIPPEEKESIFQPFTRGKAGSDSNFEGSGLGLAVVERLAAELDLHLEMDTAADVGTTFTLLIPATLMRQKCP